MFVKITNVLYKRVTRTVPDGHVPRTATCPIRPTKTTTTTTNFATQRSPQMEPIDAALAAIDALGLGEKLVTCFTSERRTQASGARFQRDPPTQQHH
jgi:hypothetical protein